MPIQTTRDDLKARFRATATGVVSIEELLTFANTHRVGDFRAYSLLFDARDATTNTTVADVQSLTTRLAGSTLKEGRRGPIAIVLGQDEAFRGMARVYQSYSTGLGLVEVELFQDVAWAERWLDERTTARD